MATLSSRSIFTLCLIILQTAFVNCSDPQYPLIFTDLYSNVTVNDMQVDPITSDVVTVGLLNQTIPFFSVVYSNNV